MHKGNEKCSHLAECDIWTLPWPLLGGQRYRPRQTPLSRAIKSMICYSDYISLQGLARIWVSLSLIGPKSLRSFTEVFEWHKLIGFVFLFSLMCMCERAHVHKLPAVHKHTRTQKSCIYRGKHYQGCMSAHNQTTNTHNFDIYTSTILQTGGNIEAVISCSLVFESSPADTCLR